MNTKPALTLLLTAATLSALGLLAQPAEAQRKQNAGDLFRPAQTMHGKTVIIPIGVHFEGRIDHTIGSSVSKQGERFEVEVSSPVLANGTDVLIPAGSAIIGEVVECTPSSRLPHTKGFPKPTGQLRVQLSGLRTPDGVTYPLVASLAGETQAQGGGGGRGRRGNERANTRLGHGVAYVGTSDAFEAVAPGAQQRYRAKPGQAPKVVTPQDIMRDPIYGSGQAGGNMSGISHVRSLIKRNFNLYILAGSPLSIRVDAPFKMGIAAAPGSTSVLDSPMDDQERIDRNGGRRFAKRGSKQAEEEEEDNAQNSQPLIPDTPGQGNFIPGNQMFQSGGQHQQGGFQGGGQPAGGAASRVETDKRLLQCHPALDKMGKKRRVLISSKLGL